MTTSFWHPFADMGAVSRSELVIERGEDVWVWDDAGPPLPRRAPRASGTRTSATAAPRSRDAVDRADGQARGLLDLRRLRERARATSSAARLAARAPMDDAKVFLASGGGDAIDTAAKLARRHWILPGAAASASTSSAARNGYHGTHGFGTSIGGIEANTSNWGPLIPHASAVPYDSLPALEDGDPARRARARRGLLLRAGDRRRRRPPAARGLHRGRRRPLRRARRSCSSSTP